MPQLKWEGWERTEWNIREMGGKAMEEGRRKGRKRGREERETGHEDVME